MYVPGKIFLTKGIGVDREKLVSFEMALREARIGPYNWVKISSILPPHCQFISVEQGIAELRLGQIVHYVIAEAASNESNRLLAASVGVAVPRNSDHQGYLSEHHAFGQDEKTAGDYAEDLAAQMLATVLGIKFDPDTSYDERANIWQLSGEIVETRNITQTGVGQNGLWTTVIAAAVVLP